MKKNIAILILSFLSALAAFPRHAVLAHGTVCYVRHVSSGLFLSATEGKVSLGSMASATAFQLEEVDQLTPNRGVYHLLAANCRMSGSFYGDLSVDAVGHSDEWSVEYVSADSASVFLGLRVPDAYCRQYLYWSATHSRLDLMRCQFDASFIDAQWQLVSLGEMDAIETPEEQPAVSPNDQRFYDLLGRPVGNSHHGLFIRGHRIAF